MRAIYGGVVGAAVTFAAGWWFQFVAPPVPDCDPRLTARQGSELAWRCHEAERENLRLSVTLLAAEARLDAVRRGAAVPVGPPPLPPGSLIPAQSLPTVPND